MAEPTFESGKPCQSRTDTLTTLTHLTNGTSPSLSSSHVFGEGPLLLSDVPRTLLNTNSNTTTTSHRGAVLGIDEAGRGCVLGPMVYAAAYWPSTDDDALSNGQFNDSKALTAKERRGIFHRLAHMSSPNTISKEEEQHNNNNQETENETESGTVTKDPRIGFVLRILPASELSRNMLRANSPYNLNDQSHHAAMDMIRAVLNTGVYLDTVYIDTVGPPASYQAKLERVFRGTQVGRFVVEKKADAKYACVSAASIVAKVCRDEMVEGWRWTEGEEALRCLKNKSKTAGAAASQTATTTKSLKEYGSGYPSDPKCKQWMEHHLLDPIFGYPNLVRFSWGPTKLALLEEQPGQDKTAKKTTLKQQQQSQPPNNTHSGGGVVVVPARLEWEAEEESEEEDGSQLKVKDFFTVPSRKETHGGSTKKRKRPRVSVLEEMGLSVVECL